MHEVTIAGKNMRNRPLRALLTAGGLAVAVAAVIALVGIASRFEQSFLELYQQRGADLVIQRVGGTVQLGSGINESLGDRIAQLPEVREVIGCLMDMVSFPKKDLFAVLVNGWAANCPVLDRVTILSGRRLQAGDRRAVMLGKNAALNLDKHVGDTIEMYSIQFKVVGVFESFNVYENCAIFILLGELQQLTDRPHHVSGYVVQVDKSAGQQVVGDVRRQIEALDPKLAVLPTGEFVRNIAQIRVVRAMAWVVSFVALVLGTAGISNTMIMSVVERRAEIGTLRALGWRTSRIIRLLLTESLVLSLLGALAGIVMAIVIVRLIGLVPQAALFFDGQLSWKVCAQGLGLALGAGALGAVYPAWWAARLAPLAALRYK